MQTENPHRTLAEAQDLIERVEHHPRWPGLCAQSPGYYEALLEGARDRLERARGRLALDDWDSEGPGRELGGTRDWLAYGLDAMETRP